MKGVLRQSALVLTALVATAVGISACGKKSSAGFAPVAFPAGFLWGSANASFQVEGNNTNDDWWAWTMLPGKIQGGDTAGLATDFYDRYDTDFAISQSDGHNAFRLSIEWSRVEPSVGVWDTAAIAHYRAMIVDARAHGLDPVVTLEHWTLPLWADDPRNPPDPQVGWLSTAVQAEFVTFCGKMAAAYGDQVDDWITFNEPMVATVAAWQGQFPPDLQGDLGRATRYAVGMIDAHAKAYEAIHQYDTVDADSDGVAASVGVAQHIVAFAPKTQSATDAAATVRLDHVFNRLFLDAIVTGNLDTSLTGVTTYHAELANHLDWVGLNYYRRMLVIGAAPDPILGIPVDDATTPHNDLGWSIYPRGMYESAMEVGSYGLPVLVTENGIADAADTQRASYIVDHLVYLKKAMDSGVNVRGYLHWSLTDNFEWAEGFAPKFGLYAMDYGTLARTPRPSSQVYARIAKENAIATDVEAEFRTVPKDAP